MYSMYDTKLIAFTAIEAPPSSWMVLSLPDEHGSKVLMAIDNNIFELDAFQAKQKVRVKKLLNLQITIAVCFIKCFIMCLGT